MSVMFRSFILLLTLVVLVFIGVQFTSQQKEKRDYVVTPVQDNNQNEEINQTISIHFVGDIMLGRVVNRRIHAQDNLSFPFQNVKDIFSADDLTIANVESPFGESGPHNELGLVFNADPRDAKRLSVAGIDVVSLANNHSLDQGIAGLRNTINVIEQNDIVAVGTGEECHAGKVVQVKNITIGVLAYSYTAYNSGGHAPHALVCDWEDFEKVLDDVDNLKQRTDVVIVLVHTGIEDSPTPTQKDKEKMYALIDQGVDIVVGHHPHVLQPIEEYRGGLITYSLGNFVFDQIEPKQKESIILNVVLDKFGYKSYSTKNIIIENLCCPKVVSND